MTAPPSIRELFAQLGVQDLPSAAGGHGLQGGLIATIEPPD